MRSGRNQPSQHYASIQDGYRPCVNWVRSEFRLASGSHLRSRLPITFWALGSNTFEALENYRRADVITRQNTAANGLIAGVYEILIERQHVNNCAASGRPGDGGQFQRTSSGTAAPARTKINAAYADLLTQDFPNKADRRRRIQDRARQGGGLSAQVGSGDQAAQGATRSGGREEQLCRAFGLRRHGAKALEQRSAQHQPARHRARPACEYPGHCVEHARHRRPRARNHIAGDVVQVCH